MTLTNSIGRVNPFGNRIEAVPLQFDDPASLTRSLLGVDVLINTYWVRFNHRHFNHGEAVTNTKVLFRCAMDAGVGRIVHVSITNPDIDSNLSYFAGKAELEADLMSLGPSYCILRPAVLFGKEDVLINNIAWALRHLPIFGVFGDGEYKLQPIYVDDMAALAAEKVGGDANEIVNAIGPETFTFRELVDAIRESLHLRTRIVNVAPELGYRICQLLGLIVDDVIITRDEIDGLMSGRLYTDARPAGSTKLSEWMGSHGASLGLRYTSELARRQNRLAAYQSN
jgi:NADH dehydrogenase